MKRAIPILPTLVVLIAVGIMIRLGFWQIDRLHQKEAMLARFAAAETMAGEVAWTAPAPGQDQADAGLSAANLYRRSTVDCRSVGGLKSVSGEDDKGHAGYAHVADCVLADGSHAPVVMGWSQAPQAPQWGGGVATGMIAPGPRLVADPPLAGLAPNARPDPGNIPNNHLSYAVQWFAFAGVALVIYVLALRKRLRP
ncbi:SURF1 family protein [Novosphingobium bradum]|uniref:SURF1-like protein n=1 Tax=Novosphingobium bradum TaxID=1737444 RepID=A0ABV7ILK4_9SPHN